MKHIKTFENYSPIQKKQIENTANSIKKKYQEKFPREDSIKRKLTEAEEKKLDKYFPDYSYSQVDKKDRIILGRSFLTSKRYDGPWYIDLKDLDELT